MISAYATGTQTATVTTEHVLSAPNVQGKFQLVVDLDAMAAGDVLELRLYQMALTGGTSQQIAYQQYAGVDGGLPGGSKTVVSDAVWNELTDANATKFTLKQTFGTGRAFPWKVLIDDALTPTTSGRTLDVTATGAAGIDWANVEGATTTVNLSATTIDTDQVVASVTGAVGSVTGAVGSVTGAVGSVTGAVGSVTGAVGSVTGNVSGSVATVTALGAGAIDTGDIAAAALNEIADAVLDRILSTGTDSGADNTTARTVRQALRVLRNKVAISAGTATVYKEDDSTASFTAAITTAAGDPISAQDPT